MLWRSHLVFKQFIKNEQHEYGIKLYLLTEPDGTVLKVDVYSGASNKQKAKRHVSIVLGLLGGKLQVDTPYIYIYR